MSFYKTNLIASLKYLNLTLRLLSLVFINLTNSLNSLSSQKTSCNLIDSNTCFQEIPYSKSQFLIEPKFIYSDSVNVTQTPLLFDIDGDCISEILTLNYNGSAILIFNSETRNLKYKINTPNVDLDLNGLAIADVNHDGIPELFIETSNNNIINLRRRLISLNLSGKLLWISDQRVDNFSQFQDEFGGTPALADFNQDGISEIYVNNKIYNSLTGILLVEGGANGLGTKRLMNFSTDAISIAGQLDENMTDLELAAGYTIYKVNIINLNGTLGNTMIAINFQLDGSYLDGYTTLGDINSDGILDVVVTTPGLNPQAVVYAYTLSNGIPNLIAKAYPPSNEYEGIGPTLIGDTDGNGNASLVFTRFKRLLSYFYDGSIILKLNWSLNTSDSSGATGLTLFDFNHDGSQEIVYRDETDLIIINSRNGIPLPFAKFNCQSITGLENPIVGDFDNSGHSKICTICGITSDNIIGKLTIFGPPDSSAPWAPARGIWNQYNYHVLNINDDLTVPRVQKNNATYKNGRYNNFYVQESLLDSNGIYRRPAASLYGNLDCINYDPISDLYTAYFNLYNKPDASQAADTGIPVAFYNGNPESGGNILGIYYTTKKLVRGDSLIQLSFSFSASNLKQLFMVVNTKRLGSGSFTSNDFFSSECDFTDNIYSSTELPRIQRIDTSICESASFVFFDTTLQQAGLYYHNLKNRIGCDSVISILDLRLIDTTLAIMDVKACDSLIWNGVRLDSSGMFTAINLNQLGCDSTTLLNLSLFKSSTSYQQTIRCDSFVWNHQSYYNSGKYMFSSLNVDGCDSTAILDLTIYHPDTSRWVQSACDSFQWNGIFYKQSGRYINKAINQFSCDSIAILDLHIDSVIQSKTAVTACDSFLWNNTVYTTSGQFRFQTKSVFGCDSIAILNLDLYKTSRSTQQIVACDSFYWNGQSYFQDGTYFYYTQNTNACDSVAILDLDLIASSQSLSIVNTCDSIYWNNQSYTQSGRYFFTTKNAAGCDSLAILQLTILKSDSNLISITACDSLTWNGTKITQAGTYPFKTQNNAGCDSIVTLQLKLNHASKADLSISACDSIAILGQTFKQSGDYLFPLQNAQLCDSLLTIHFTTLSHIQSDSVEACDQYIWPANDSIYLKSGIYLKKLVNQFGCDSIFLLNLNLQPSYIKFLDTAVCMQYFWPASQQILKQSGDYNFNLKSIAGCDSILNLKLTILPEIQNTDSVTTQENPYIWDVNQQAYTQSGIYREAFKSSLGCDSIHWLVLQINKEIEIYYPNIINLNSSQNARFNLYIFGSQAVIDLLSIYDRWGNLLWQTHTIQANNQQQGWNGTANNQFVLPGVYVWHASIRLPDGSIIKKSGDLTVIR